MQLTLKRIAVIDDGAFGVLLADGVPFAVCLERTYDRDGGQFVKIQPGRHKCKRSWYHRRGHATYEIEVPGHTRILFHKGNWETDSEGCVLVGEQFGVLKKKPVILQSGQGFDELMTKAGDADEFDLLVIDCDERGTP